MRWFRPFPADPSIRWGRKLDCVRSCNLHRVHNVWWRIRYVPAFLADLFGEENVGAIHGSLLTAWSAAAVTGPVIITQLLERAKAMLAPGESRVHIYDQPLRVLAIMLVAGFILTLLVRPLKHAGQTELHDATGAIARHKH